MNKISVEELDNSSTRRAVSLIFSVILGVVLVFLYSEIAQAKFEPDAAVQAATEPLLKMIQNHWGKAVMLTGGTSALLGEGDGRQRAVRAAIASGASGAVILGMQALLL